MIEEYQFFKKDDKFSTLVFLLYYSFFFYFVIFLDVGIEKQKYVDTRCLYIPRKIFLEKRK